MITDFAKMKEVLDLIAAGAEYTLLPADTVCENCYIITVTKTIDGDGKEFISAWMCGDDIIDKAWRYEDLST